MKTILNICLVLLSFVFTVTSCDDISYDPVLSPDANTVASLSTTAVTLTQDTESETAVTVSWNQPELGFNSATINYRVLLSLDSDDLSNAQSFTVVTALQDEITGQELNTRLINLGLEPEVEATVYVTVETILSTVNSLYSEAVALSATPYASILDLSTTWGIVGDAAPNGWDGPDAPFYQTGTNNVFVAYVTLGDGQIKFRENNDWALNYGDTGVDGTLEEGGENIDITAGTYKITINLNDLTYSIEDYYWGLVGDATANGWDGPDMALEYDPTSDQWRALVSLGAGAVKFRLNNDWGLNYGDSEADGTLDSGGDDIIVTAGNYLVTMNLNDLTYTFETIDLWGIVGDATPNSWDGPDIALKLDYTSDGNVWYNNSFDLTDGRIKFRTNNDWALNYGDTDADGTLDDGGDDISVTAGNYSVTINLEELTYTLVEN